MRSLPSPEIIATVRSAVAAGDVIAAIQKIRAATGADLTQAKEIAERLAAGRSDAEAFAVDVGTQAATAPAYPQVLAAISAGRKIEAIKLYRKSTGCELVHAREAVERMAA